MALFDEDVVETMSRSDAVDMMIEQGSLQAREDAEPVTPQRADAPKAETTPAPTEPTPATPATPDAPAEPAPPTEPAADAAPVVPAVAAPPAPAERTALVVNAAGESLAIEGSYTDPDGNAFIPKQHVEAILRDIGQGIAAKKQYQHLQRREDQAKRLRAEADSVVSTERVQAQTITEGLAEILQQLPELEPAIGPAIQQLLLKAELAVERHKLALATAAAKPAPEVVAAEEREQKMGAVTALIARDGRGAYPALFRTPDIAQRTLARVLDRAPELVRLANGQLTNEDIRAIDTQMQWLNESEQRVLVAEQATKTASDAAKRNAAVTQTPAPTVARSVSAAGDRKRDDDTGRFTKDTDEDDEAAFRSMRRHAREAIMASPTD